VPRRLGQHFLFQRSILDRIAGAACGPACPLCIEIGPGPGGLTVSLLERCQKLIAIEIDPALAAALRQKYAAEPRFTLLEQDVLTADLSAWGPAVVCGNLPYYITSPIIEKVLSLGPLLLSAVFLVQKEVADRIAAAPGARDYGYFSVAVQARAGVERLFIVKPSSFKPPPKVDSAVIRLTPRPHPDVTDIAGFLRFAALCFRHKRKTLLNNLRVAYPSSLLEATPGLNLRAEQLSIQALAALHARLTAAGA
jgi:16S rRNA (adenine1518-N6/adenine1519-N6)-dimethyltransferase